MKAAQPEGTSQMATAVESLGEFVSNTPHQDIPVEVVNKSKVRLLDAIGCAIAGRDSETTSLALKMAAKWRASDSGASASYWLSGGHRGSIGDTSFVNSVLVHSILHEDVGQGGHPACNVVPAAVAVAEAFGASGAELLAAIALGYEIQFRIGSGNLLNLVGDRGLRGTTTSGTFGAAVAAGRLMGLRAPEMANCLAFCASLAVPGIEEPLLVGSRERCLHMGANTRSGVVSAELAQVGFDGARTALEGDSGFYRAYGSDENLPIGVLEGLGDSWNSIGDQLVFKPYPTAGWNVGPIFAAEQVARVEGFKVEDVEDIEVLHTWWRRNTGYVYPGPFETIEQALVSCNFAVAATLVQGEYNWQVVQESLEDPVVESLARRVSVQGVATWGFTDGRISVRMANGQVHSVSADSIPEHLIKPDWENAVAKFLSLTKGIVSAEVAHSLVARVEDLEEKEVVGVLLA